LACCVTLTAIATAISCGGFCLCLNKRVIAIAVNAGAALVYSTRVMDAFKEYASTGIADLAPGRKHPAQPRR
jgi:hypothetical protein